jgi:tRNA threonylcarbamoyl adenosine modification protein YeaZ
LNILLINSSDNNAFVALSDGANLYVSYASDFKNTTSKKQPDNLISSLRKISEEHREALDNIKAVAVTTGPGSFTGIRVGLAIAKGFAAAKDLPIIPMSNFELIYNRLPDTYKNRKCCILIPAKLPEYYYSIWQRGAKNEKGCIDSGQLSLISDKNTTIVGNFIAETNAKHSYFECINEENLGSELDSMLRLAQDYFDKGFLKKPEDTEPLYMKDFTFRKQN